MSKPSDLPNKQKKTTLSSQTKGRKGTNKFAKMLFEFGEQNNKCLPFYNRSIAVLQNISLFSFSQFLITVWTLCPLVFTSSTQSFRSETITPNSLMSIY